MKKLTKHREAEKRRSEMGTEQASMNEKESHSDSTQNSESNSDPFAIQKTRSEVEQLLKTNKVHPISVVTSVDPLYYTKEKKVTIYSHTMEYTSIKEQNTMITEFTSSECCLTVANKSQRWNWNIWL